MPAKNILRILVALQAVLWIGQRVATSFSLRTLGMQFGVPIANISPLSVQFGGKVDNLVFVGLFLCLLLTGIGLCVFSSVARPLYVAVNLIAILAGLLHGPLVRSGSMDFFYSANILLVGVMVILLYQSPLQHQYHAAGATAVAVARTSEPPPPPRESDAVNPRINVPDLPPRRARFCGACGAANPGTKFCLECGKPIE